MVDLPPCLTDPSIRMPWLTDRLRDERERSVGEIEQLTQTVAALDPVIGDLSVPTPGPH